MVTDMAGNVKSACLNDDEKFTIDITAPNVGVRFCDKDDEKRIRLLSQEPER